MKKLMIAAAIVCATVVAQAVTCNWAISTSKEIYAGNDTDIYSGTSGYFFQKTGTMTTTALLAALADGTKNISTIEGAKAVTIEDGMLDTQKFSTEGPGTGTQSFIFAVQAADKVFIWEGTKLNDLTESALESGTLATFNPKSASQAVVGAAKDGYSSSGWYTTAVPEPTSGLLLLLGVAGLALKRKRA